MLYLLRKKNSTKCSTIRIFFQFQIGLKQLIPVVRCPHMSLGYFFPPIGSFFAIEGKPLGSFWGGSAPSPSRRGAAGSRAPQAVLRNRTWHVQWVSRGSPVGLQWISRGSAAGRPGGSSPRTISGGCAEEESIADTRKCSMTGSAPKCSPPQTVPEKKSTG